MTFSADPKRKKCCDKFHSICLRTRLQIAMLTVFSNKRINVISRGLKPTCFGTIYLYNNLTDDCQGEAAWRGWKWSLNTFSLLEANQNKKSHSFQSCIAQKIAKPLLEGEIIFNSLFWQVYKLMCRWKHANLLYLKLE